MSEDLLECELMERGYSGFSQISLVLSAKIRCIRVIRVPLTQAFASITQIPQNPR
jgi:hypothetical protein